MKPILKSGLSIGLMVLVASFYNVAIAQPDSTVVVQPDSTMQKNTEDEKKNDNGRNDEFIVYTGVNINQLTLSSSNYESSSALGYHLGVNYKRGQFFYWQAGARFNNSVYELNNHTDTSSFAVSSIDIPLTGGINILSATDRILGVRIFVSAVPSFVIGVEDNDLDIQKDDINSFILYGQIGFGVNVAFLVIETGYNYGLQDLLTVAKSNPGQVFFNLGFRF